MPKKQFKNTCIFCGDSSTTYEHVFPKWIGTKLDLPNTHSVYNREVFTTTKNGQKTRDHYPKRSSNPIGTTQIKKVCQPCNGEWLSQFEEKIIPIYESLINNEDQQLQPEEQKMLSVWATLISIKWAHTENNTLGYSEKHWNPIFSDRNTPKNTRVWIGRSDGDDIQAFHRVMYIGRTSEAPLAAKLISTALKIGPVVFHVLSHEDDTFDFVKQANLKNTAMTLISRHDSQKAICAQKNIDLDRIKIGRAHV